MCRIAWYLWFRFFLKKNIVTKYRNVWSCSSVKSLSGHDVKPERLPKKVMAVAHSMVSYVPGTATPVALSMYSQANVLSGAVIHNSIHSM